MCPKRTSSSRKWLKEHFSDEYVIKAQKSGYRSRAIFKLEEIHLRDFLFKPGMVVVDLGASPGGWSQLITKLIGRKGRIIALDILPMEPLPNVEFILGDFSDEAIQAELLASLGKTHIDWVISDIAPNLSGVDSIDQPRSMLLCEMVLEFALTVLPASGGFLIKVFQGEGFEDFLKAVRAAFKKVLIRKPKASRGRSREVYLVGLGRK